MKKYSLLAGMIILLAISFTSCAKKFGCYYSVTPELKSTNHLPVTCSDPSYETSSTQNDEYKDHVWSATKN